MLKQTQAYLKNVWPDFLKHEKDDHLSSFYTVTDYTHIWIMSIFTLVVTVLSPLALVALIHYQLLQRSVDSEMILRTERLTSNAKNAIEFFMEERLNALRFTVNEIGYEALSDNTKLLEILKNLKFGFGGLTDLSIIDTDGNQIAYAGPFDLEGKNYKNQAWFSESLKNENFISDVFTGYRGVPHIIVAVRSTKPDGSFFTLRGTLDTERLIQMILSYKTGTYMDIFLVNHEGITQTPSNTYGEIFTRTHLKVPAYSQKTEVIMSANQEQNPDIIGYSYISTHTVTTPFILIVNKEKEGMMHAWLDLRRNFNWIIGASGAMALIVIILTSTFMVNKLYQADKTKAKTMIQMEQSQQLASIGQLAAGIAHEINNPLALINETAGYLRDIYSFADEQHEDQEIIEFIDSILGAVERCATITQQLLGFVRQFDIRIREVNLRKVVSDVLSFHKKESEYRGIHVSTTIPDTIPNIETDSGKLQQVMVNLINNAFQAVEEGGCLDIIISQSSEKTIKIVIQDTGCGIPEENLKKIHEPFFSTKQNKQGTGLGLYITYGLVKKLHGIISVQSTEGVGTIFTITLPIKIDKEALA